MASLTISHPEILTAAIPYASDIERMGLERMPLGGYIKKPIHDRLRRLMAGSFSSCRQTIKRR
jgi:hypothetical protein